MKKILCYFLFFPIFLSAQVNESDSLSVKAKLSLTGFWQGGNVETLIFRAQSEVSFTPWKKGVFKTKNSYVYQEFGKEKADEDILSLNFLYFNPESLCSCCSLWFVRDVGKKQRMKEGAVAAFAFSLPCSQEQWRLIILLLINCTYF